MIGDFSTLRQPTPRRTGTRTFWRTSAAANPVSGSQSSWMEPSIQHRLQPTSPLSPSSVELVGSDLSSSRQLSAAGRGSRVSPYDIIRLADDKLDRQRAAAAAAARCHFILTTTRSTRSRNQPVSTAAAAEGEIKGCRKPNPRRTDTDENCFLHYTTIVDHTGGDTR